VITPRQRQARALLAAALAAICGGLPAQAEVWPSPHRVAAVVAGTAAPVPVDAPTRPVQLYDEDGWYWREPPPPLPQQLGGIVRPRRIAGPSQVERIADVFSAMSSCWVLPGDPTPTGQELTLRLAFKRNGDILGRPRITYYKSGANPDDRKPFTDSVLAALDRCLPLPFSPGFGAAVAGRPFVLRFVDARRA
jgi:hypothetical protein